MASETSPILAGAPASSSSAQRPITVYDSQLSHPGRVSSDPGPPCFRSSPLSLLRYDLMVILKHAPELLHILSPRPANGSDIAFGGIIAQVVYVAVSLAITGVGLWSFAVGVPVPPVLALGLVVVAVWVMSRWQGEVKMNDQGGDGFEDEAWMFVNGIGTSYSGLQLILTRLHVLFGRRVIGIHNKTFGVWWDLIECMLQRDLLWGTADVRVGYETICKQIRDPKKKKVVLLAHSQGGIIMSTWVDQLLSDFPSDALRKVEIYTFAAAANHFSVPSAAVYDDVEEHDVTESTGTGGAVEATGTGSTQVGRRFVFGIVEHFVNTRDYVSLIGLLQFAPPPPTGTTSGVLPPTAAEGRFAGRIFRREGQTGHLLLAHYLKPGDLILDHPAVDKYSQLVKYKNRQRAVPEKRYWKETVATESPAEVAAKHASALPNQGLPPP